MLIPVEYVDHTVGYVDQACLEELIRAHMVVVFKQSREWVRLRREAIRAEGETDTGLGG